MCKNYKHVTRVGHRIIDNNVHKLSVASQSIIVILSESKWLIVFDLCVFSCIAFSR